MIIKKLTQPLTCEIYKTEGHGTKEKRIKLYTLSVPEQPLVYSLTNQAFEDRGLKLEVNLFSGNDPYPERAQGQWSIETFARLVEGTREATETALPFLCANPGFIAEAFITETTHVWSTLMAEEIGGGFFTKGENQFFQRILLEILGLQSNWIRWEPTMLEPLIWLRDSFIYQRDQFIQEVQAVQASQMR